MELKELESRLKEAQFNTSRFQKEVSDLRNKIHNEKKKQTILKQGNFVSDHCVIRFLERRFGFDLESVREEILKTQGLEKAVRMGASKFIKDGLVFVIENYKIVTVYPK